MKNIYPQCPNGCEQMINTKKISNWIEQNECLKCGHEWTVKHEKGIKEETKMEKPIFESEKNYIKFMDDIIPDSIVSKWSIIKSSGKDAKEKGYIKKSSLEIARENYDLFIKKQYSETGVPRELFIYIHELEKEITRLQNK